jgi:hypothetical protein
VFVESGIVHNFLLFETLFSVLTYYSVCLEVCQVDFTGDYPYVCSRSFVQQTQLTLPLDFSVITSEIQSGILTTL